MTELGEVYYTNPIYLCTYYKYLFFISQIVTDCIYILIILETGDVQRHRELHENSTIKTWSFSIIIIII